MRVMLYDPATDRYFIAGQWIPAEAAVQVEAILAPRADKLHMAQAHLRGRPSPAVTRGDA